jgi:hypothetical protein
MAPSSAGFTAGTYANSPLAANRKRASDEQRAMRRRTMILAGGATAVALALGSLLGGVLAHPSAQASSAAPRGALAERALGPAASGTTETTVRELEAQVRAAPRDPDLLTELGFAYQLRWRETADASFLPLSQRALGGALRAQPDDPNAVLGLGSLALIRHEFRVALAYGQRSRRLLPGSARSSSSAGTGRPSRRSTACRRCARASLPTRGSRTRAS